MAVTGISGGVVAMPCPPGVGGERDTPRGGPLLQYRCYHDVVPYQELVVHVYGIPATVHPPHGTDDRVSTLHGLLREVVHFPRQFSMNLD